MFLFLLQQINNLVLTFICWLSVWKTSYVLEAYSYTTYYLKLLSNRSQSIYWSALTAQLHTGISSSVYPQCVVYTVDIFLFVLPEVRWYRTAKKAREICLRTSWFVLFSSYSVQFQVIHSKIFCNEKVIYGCWAVRVLMFYNRHLFTAESNTDFSSCINDLKMWNMWHTWIKKGCPQSIRLFLEEHIQPDLMFSITVVNSNSNQIMCNKMLQNEKPLLGGWWICPWISKNVVRPSTGNREVYIKGLWLYYWPRASPGADSLET